MSLRFAGFLLAILALGCDHVPTRPADSGAPRLVLTLSSPTGDPGHPVMIKARVTNVGSQSIRYSQFCGAPDVSAVVRSPDRTNVVDLCAECPNVVCVACPVHVVLLAPGESVGYEVVFDGTLWRCDGSYQGPSGVYGVEAAFSWSTIADQQWHSVRRETTFQWTVPELN